MNRWTLSRTIVLATAPNQSLDKTLSIPRWYSMSLHYNFFFLYEPSFPIMFQIDCLTMPIHFFFCFMVAQLFFCFVLFCWVYGVFSFFFFYFWNACLDIEFVKKLFGLQWDRSYISFSLFVDVVLFSSGINKPTLAFISCRSLQILFTNRWRYAHWLAYLAWENYSGGHGNGSRNTTPLLEQVQSSPGKGGK